MAECFFLVFAYPRVLFPSGVWYMEIKNVLKLAYFIYNKSRECALSGAVTCLKEHSVKYKIQTRSSISAQRPLTSCLFYYLL